MKNLKVTTVIALSSALLLTACGGSSGSSGDKNNPNASTESKMQALVGYWKSDCDYDKNDNKSYQGYAQWDSNNGNMIIRNMFNATFDGQGCRGKASFSHDSEEDPRGKVIPKKEVAKAIHDFTFDGINKIILKDEDGSYTLYRMDAKDFPKYDYTNPVEW